MLSRQLGWALGGNEDGETHHHRITYHSSCLRRKCCCCENILINGSSILLLFIIVSSDVCSASFTTAHSTSSLFVIAAFSAVIRLTPALLHMSAKRDGLLQQCAAASCAEEVLLAIHCQVSSGEHLSLFHKLYCTPRLLQQP